MHALFDIECNNENWGQIKIKLFNKLVPNTVDNFVQLAEGTHNKNTVRNGEPYYDGLIFHRVIDGFMLQGGCPEGSGMGGPGYKFEDEFHPELKHGKAGMLSMANAGPNTNGSQFFITVAATPHLDFDHPMNQMRKGGHAVFGEVVEGMDLVNKISITNTDARDRPEHDIIMKKVTIVRD